MAVEAGADEVEVFLTEAMELRKGKRARVSVLRWRRRREGEKDARDRGDRDGGEGSGGAGDGSDRDGREGGSGGSGGLGGDGGARGRAGRGSGGAGRGVVVTPSEPAAEKGIKVEVSSGLEEERWKQSRTHKIP